MVIGFHHKKGCQIEFVYPVDNRIKNDNPNSITESNSSDLYKLPKKWRHLPSLALPDGSHNYDTDYIYFHLEDDDLNDETTPTEAKQTKTKPNRTIFGVSCYRQINASELVNKDVDVTRNTLQKSVCILSEHPIYSSIRLKLFSITSAYFEQKDFSKTDILINAFNSLRQSYDFGPTNTHKLLSSQRSSDLNEKYLMGLSLTDLVSRYQHKIVVLFKLLLLQKKCLFQIKPVSNLSNTIMSLVSLMPDIFIPSANSTEAAGLDNCAGFFDSIDLVNSNLERKSKPKTKRDDLVLSYMQTTTAPAGNGSNGHAGKKIKKKKLMSFSKKPNSSSSLTPSFSSMSIKSLKASLTEDTPVQNETAQAKKIENDEDESKKTPNKKSEDPNEPQTGNQITSLLRSKVSNVFKFADWNTPSPKSAKQQNSKNENKQSTNSKPKQPLRSSLSYNQFGDASFTNENENNNKKDELQLSEFLDMDFGMPFNLFNEFNVLHPYLSLYYLEYFTMINKMNTKLYCTTSLMMSMLKEKPKEAVQEAEVASESNETSASSTAPAQANTPNQPTNFGYSVGATNILFKQRLYEELDAFIEESDVDLRNNEVLKKQLQLTTADIRFADYIIKNVNANRAASSLQDKNQNTPTLLSFKKTSSITSIDKTPLDTSVNKQEVNCFA
jgi:hypothetical protein